MAYIKFASDPNEQRVNKSFANLCSDQSTKNQLQLFNQCFNIYSGDQTIASFCDLSKFDYPVDGFLNIDMEVCHGDTLVLFDNGLSDIPGLPSGGVSPDIMSLDKNYVRGYLIYVYYPKLDGTGADVEPADKTCQLTFVNRALQQTSIPLFNFSAHFCNPNSRNPDDLINKLEIINQNANFSIKVKALLIYVKSSLDPKDCAC